MLKSSIYGLVKPSVILTDYDQELEKSLLAMYPSVLEIILK